MKRKLSPVLWELAGVPGSVQFTERKVIESFRKGVHIRYCPL